MSVSYACDDTTRVITWTVSDSVRSRDWHIALDQAAADPTVIRVRPIAMIVDLRDRKTLPPVGAVTAFAFSIRERMARLGAPRIKIAVVVPSAASHGMVRIAEAYLSEVLEVEIFSDIEAAGAWIRVGVKPDHQSA